MIDSSFNTRKVDAMTTVCQKLPFTRMVEKMVKIIEAHQEDCDDPISQYAPSECLRDIERFFQERVDRTFAQNGWTPEEFRQEAENRTNAKWVYVNLGQVC